MGIIGWIIFGLVVGALAKFVMPGKDPGGWIITTLLGVVGALVGGFLGTNAGPLRDGRARSLDRERSWGAVLVLWIYRKTRKTA